jgi:hypothetical protein
MMAHIYNPSYSRGRDKGEFQFKASPGKMLGRHHLNQHAKHGGVLVIPAMWEA